MLPHPQPRPRAGARGVPPPRTWSRPELLLAGLLLALAAAAWLATAGLAMPDMRSGILTGLRPMGGAGTGTGMDPNTGADMGADHGTGPGGAAWAPALGFFLLTWVVMMAAMMLPAVTPFTVGLRRLLGGRAGARAAPGTLGALTAGYLAVWGAAGLLGYGVVRAFETAATGGDAVAVRVGAGVLVLAGAYQFTPLKDWCLARCRSPLALVMRYAEPAVRSRRGAFTVGVRHGGYCLGCCWALMAVLLALGVMNLVWMAAVAAVIALEKAAPRAELTGRALGVLLAGCGVALLAAA